MILLAFRTMTVVSHPNAVKSSAKITQFTKFTKHLDSFNTLLNLQNICILITLYKIYKTSEFSSGLWCKLGFFPYDTSPKLDISVLAHIT